MKLSAPAARVRGPLVPLVGFIGALLGQAHAVSAQSLPDAGAVRQQIEQQRQAPLPEAAAPEFLPPPAPMKSMGGVTVTVESFRFDGNTLLTNKQLTAAVAGFVGHPIDFAGLQNAAIAVANAYRDAGWVVRTYIPQQQIDGATVAIQIVEARFGRVRVEGETTRIAASRLRRMVESAQPLDKPVSIAALDRAVLLINDLPGVSATARLATGGEQSETNLVLTPLDGPLVNGSITLDNTGSRFTGPLRAIAMASLNDRFGLGDRADALLLHSEGNDYGRLGYSLPVTASGLRVGVDASHLDYDIVTREFKALDAHGSSDSFGVEATYPVWRTRLRNVYLSVTGDHSSFENSSAGATTTDYSVQAATASLFGNLYDQVFGGGINTASVSFTQGEVDLSGSPNQLADALTTRTDGSFKRMNFAVSRLQVINERLALFASVAGQRANKNLDSSQKMYLGGSQGIRAYPEDEAGGAEGMLAKFEVRKRMTDSINGAAFADWGRVRINKDNDIAGAALRNSVSLKGIGISATWTASFGLNVQATYARRLGDNPNPTPGGDDQDGTLVKNRVWLQASMPF
jgi:hemolysin activation/secretion protein